MLSHDSKILKTGTCTLANLKLWIVDGESTISFSNSTDPLNKYLGCEIEIRDSNGNIIRGWLRSSY